MNVNYITETDDNIAVNQCSSAVCHKTLAYSVMLPGRNRSARANLLGTMLLLGQQLSITVMVWFHVQ